jgi:predicted amidohydrolase YtcJ
MAAADLVTRKGVPPEEVADLEVRATFLAGRQVYAS